MRVFKSFDDLPEALYQGRVCKVISTQHGVGRDSTYKSGIYYTLAHKTSPIYTRYYHDIHSDDVELIKPTVKEEPNEVLQEVAAFNRLALVKQ